MATKSFPALEVAVAEIRQGGYRCLVMLLDQKINPEGSALHSEMMVVALYPKTRKIAKGKTFQPSFHHTLWPSYYNMQCIYCCLLLLKLFSAVVLAVHSSLRFFICLFHRAIRHPASGYVQGINDLATPFLIVFLSEHLEGDIDNWSICDLPSEKIFDVEADCYWCLSKLLDGMQDHYTFAQPGIQRLVFRLKELVRRIDETVSAHMEEQGLEFLQFAFRWFNCLLIREIPFNLVTRLWDTYLAEGDALPDFLVYIFASFLLTWSEKLQKLDFQELVMFLQHLPTRKWSDQELEMVLSRAYMWHSMFNNSPSHLAS